MQKRIFTRPSVFQVLTLVFFLTAFSTRGLLKAQKMPAQFIFQPENHKKYAKDQSAIYQVMSKYYEAVERANIDLLKEVFHSDWFMRDTDTPKEATLNVENKATFIKRAEQ